MPPVFALDWGHRLEAEKIPGAVALQVAAGHPVLVKTFGVQRHKAKIPLSENTLLPLDALSELFLSNLLLQDVKAGKLDLDENINSYLQKLQVVNPFSSALSLRHLLSHRDGFPEWWAGRWVENSRKVPSLEKNLNYGLKPLVLAPGSTPTPGSWGAVLEGYLLETLNNKPVADQIKAAWGLKSLHVGLPAAERRLQGHLLKEERLLTYPERLYSTAPLQDQLYLSVAEMGKMLEKWAGTQVGMESISPLLFSSGREASEPTLGVYRLAGAEGLFYVESHHLGVSQLLLVQPREKKAVYLSLGREDRDLIWEWAYELLGWQPTKLKPSVSASQQGVSGLYGYPHFHRQSLAALARLHRGLLKVEENSTGVLTLSSQGLDPFGGFVGQTIWEPVGPLEYQRQNRSERLRFSKLAEGGFALHSEQGQQGVYFPLVWQKHPLVQAAMALFLALCLLLCSVRQFYNFWNHEEPLTQAERSEAETSDPSLLMAIAAACGWVFLLGFPLAFFHEALPGEMSLAWQDPLNPWLFGLLLLPLFQIIFTVIALLLAWSQFKTWGRLDRGLALLQAGATFALVWVLYTWHLIGFQF